MLAACKDVQKPGALVRVNATPVSLNLLDTLQQKRDLSDIVYPVKFIPLQVPESEVISKIDQALVYNDKLICADKKFSSLLVFDTTGRFVKKIGRLGKGAGKFLSIENVFINAAAKEITVFSNSSGELVSFGLENDNTHSITLPFNGWRCVPLEQNYAFYLNFLGILNNHHNFFLTDKNGKIVKEDLAYSSLIQSGFEMSGAITPAQSGYLLAPAFSDTIYFGTAGELQPAYVLGLGAHKVPVESLINTSEFMTKGKNYAYAGPGLLDMPGALFFDYVASLTEQFAVYDKKNRQLFTPATVSTSAASVMFTSPVGIMNNNRAMVPIYPTMLRYYEEQYPPFKDEIKRTFPELYNILQNPQTARQPILAVYAVKQ